MEKDKKFLNSEEYQKLQEKLGKCQEHDLVALGLISKEQAKKLKKKNAK